MPEGYEPFKCKIFYAPKDEVLETCFYVAAVTDTGAPPFNNYADQAFFVEDWLSTVLDALLNIWTTEVQLIGVNLDSVDNNIPSMNISDFRTGIQTGETMPNNCTANVTMFATRGGNVVHGGLRISGLPESQTNQGRIVASFLNTEFAQLRTALMTPFASPPGAADYLPAIRSADATKVPRTVLVETVQPHPVLGSRKDRNANQPQGRPSVTP